MRPEEVIEIEKANVDLIARTLRIPKGKTKAAKRTLRLSAESFEVLKRRIQEREQAESKLKDCYERVAKRLKIAPEKVAERERLKALYVFPARKSGKTGHPTQDHQQAEMDRIDGIRQEHKRRYAEALRSQAHDRPTANGNSEDFGRPEGKSREIVP